MNRTEVTEMIVAAKIKKGFQWADVARMVSLSKAWVTAGGLGRMTFDKNQATASCQPSTARWTYSARPTVPATGSTLSCRASSCLA
jgi:hypothetical protein